MNEELLVIVFLSKLVSIKHDCQYWHGPDPGVAILKSFLKFIPTKKYSLRTSLCGCASNFLCMEWLIACERHTPPKDRLEDKKFEDEMEEDEDEEELENE